MFGYRAAFLSTCWMMATAPRHTIKERISYLNHACRLQRLCAVSQQKLLVLSRFTDYLSAHRSYWHDYLGCCISLSGQSFQSSILDHLPCGVDHEHCTVSYERLQQHILGERNSLPNCPRIAPGELLARSTWHSGHLPDKI